MLGEVPEGRLVGMLTVDDAMSILESEETEDFALHGGHSPLRKPYLAVSTFGLARARAVWLMVLIVAAGLTVNVLQVFEGTLARDTRLALFVPLLIGTGGNSGAQASTAVIRAMAIGEVRFTDLPRIVWREARVGVMLDAILGAAVIIPIGTIWGYDLGIVVGVSLVTICTWASLAGSGLPMVARRLGVDPAVVSAPFISTLVDATGLLIYMVVAGVVLGQGLGAGPRMGGDSFRQRRFDALAGLGQQALARDRGKVACGMGAAKCDLLRPHAARAHEVFEVVEDRLHPRAEFLVLVAGQVADVAPHRHDRAADDHLVVLLLVGGLAEPRGDGEERLVEALQNSERQVARNQDSRDQERRREPRVPGTAYRRR